MNLAIMLIYLIIISFFSFFLNLNVNIAQTPNSESEITNLGFSDYVVVTTKQVKWYGSIVKEHSEKLTSKLYVLDIIPITLKSKGINFLFIHVCFILILGIFNFIVITTRLKNKRRYNKYETMA